MGRSQFESDQWLQYMRYNMTDTSEIAVLKTKVLTLTKDVQELKRNTQENKISTGILAIALCINITLVLIALS